MSTIFSTNSQTLDQTLKQHGQIILVDNTRPPEEQEEEPQHREAAGSDSDAPETSAAPPLSKKITPRKTREAWRDERAKWKYRKYQEDRFLDPQSPILGDSSRPGASARTSTNLSTTSAPRVSITAETPTPLSATPTSSLKPKTSRLQRGQQKVKSLFTKRQYTSLEGDSAIDMLYENQRGWFFFGNPLFSSQSLLNFDPPAWVNAYGKSSAVNITNAQVPDPLWQWVWHTWYVDMSPDVDEDGWQYSFMFQNKFHWHGTHPWIHSFVRRRRWIRKRVRMSQRVEGVTEGGKAAPEPHRFNQDYFTIHSTAAEPNRRESLTPYPASTGLSSPTEPTVAEENEIDNVPSLLRALKRDPLDRTKIRHVLQFVDRSTGDALDDFPSGIPQILSLFLYQSSRRRLLSEMLRKIGSAEEHRAEHERRGKAEFANEKRRIDGLLRGVEAAEREVQRLEYWSDVRDVVRKGETFGAVKGKKDGIAGGLGAEWDHGWVGLDASGADGEEADLRDAVKGGKRKGKEKGR